MTSTNTDTTLDSAGRATVMGIHHVGITARDAEASAVWYERVFGFVRHFVEPHWQSEGGGYCIVIGTPDHSFGIGLDHHPGNPGDPFDPTRTGLDHLSFTVASIEELRSWAHRLDDLGVTNSGVYPVDGMPVWLLTFEDPDGVQLELITFGEGSEQ